MNRKFAAVVRILAVVFTLLITFGQRTQAQLAGQVSPTDSAMAASATGSAQQVQVQHQPGGDQRSLTLAADYCPKRSEGFAFAGLMSIMNLADVFSNNIGAFLYEHVFDSRLGPLIIVSAATTAFAALLVPLLRLDGKSDEAIPA